MPKAYDLELQKVVISSLIEIAKGVYILGFKRNFNFKAGQVIAITTREDLPARLYSIASGIDDEDVKILFNVVPEGALTTELSEMKVGDEILISQAFGQFYGDDSPAYWIAAGTGIAPFASMFYSGQTNQKVIIHGGRYLESFYFEDDFKSLNDNYIRCCSQEKGEDVFEGRLTVYLREKKDYPADYKYYLCGSSEMVVECRDILISKGIPYEQIFAEIYF